MNVAFLQKYRGKRVAVALSGGMDSVCLLHVFHENAAQYGIALSAITCEHGLRGEESLRDFNFVKTLCLELNVPLFAFSADVKARAASSGRGLEEEGRAFRYECFFKILNENKVDLVATAHHQDDLAETVLFRLARGTSLAGVASIKEHDGIVRPFLGVSKEEICAYMRERGFAYCEDSTNTDERYARNAIRHSVMPALACAVPGASGHIASFARRAGEDDSYLQTLAEQELQRVGNDIFVSASLVRPLFFRACLIAANELGSGRDHSEQLLLEIEKLKSLQSGKKICLKCGVEAAREGDKIVFYVPKTAQKEELAFGEGMHEMYGFCVHVTKKPYKNALFADFDAFPAGCVLRVRREGDTFTPYGGKSKPLKQFLVDRKVPARVSKTLPVVACGSEIYAVFGVEISDKVKVTEQTATRVYLHAEPK